MRESHALHSNRRFSTRFSARRRRLIVAGLIVAAVISVFALAIPGGDAGSVSAQLSPLSPLGAPAVTGGAPLSLTQFPPVNVMASAQAGLTRLALLLFGIIIGVGIIIWRQA